MANVIAVTACARFFTTLPLKQVTVSEIRDASNISVDLQSNSSRSQGKVWATAVLGKSPSGYDVPDSALSVSVHTSACTSIFFFPS